MNEDGDYMDGYNDGFIDGRGTMLKPLRWRTGPVPEDMTVFFMYFWDGFGIDYDTGEGTNDGNISSNRNVRWEDARWIPLSEILALVEEE